MKQISKDELKQIQLEILKDVHNYCTFRGLRYFLSRGTLLGAARHKGYIPWDDDIDIMMPRPDYDIFIKEFNGWQEHLCCATFENYDSYVNPFAKVYNNRTSVKQVGVKPQFMRNMGINIDVFPNEERNNQKYKREMRFLIQLHYIKIFNDFKWTFKKNLIRPIATLFSVPSLTKKINELCQKYDFENSKKLGVEIAEKTTTYFYVDVMVIIWNSRQ
ncbi:hypothetical protein FACS189421_14100 [Bacteroidia bacterium]|nr:hypothetical protein FACS189421_14100 [Bacteroidia bacterium]